MQILLFSITIINIEVYYIIVRFDYLNEIKKFINVPLVKVLYVVRSCGKSTISLMLENIVYIELKRRKYCLYW